MAEPLAIALRQSLSSLDAVQELMPLWTDWGIQDSGIWVHSLGCSFWTVLGQHLGAVAVSETNAPCEGRFANVGSQVRSDSIWFSVASRQPEILVEFERYNGPRDKVKLIGKAKNLLLAYHRWGETASTLVLAYWTKGLTSLPRHADLMKIVQEGFETSFKERVFGSAKSELLFYQFVLREDRDGLLRLSEIIQRGLP